MWGMKQLLLILAVVALVGCAKQEASSSVAISDNNGSYTLTVNTGEKRFKAKDAKGVELFDGPVDSDEQRDGLDRDLIKKLEQLEGMGKGNPEPLSED